jgi:hypothetical protein
MNLSSPRLIAAVVAASALVPAGAMAAGVHSHPKLGGSPQMRLVDAHHATLQFASDRLPRTASGKVDAKITFLAGLRVSDLRPTGRHGEDTVYSARVSSAKPLVVHRKFRARFRLGDSGTVERSVKLFRQGEHG